MRTTLLALAAVALLIFALIESDSTTDFLRLASCLDRHTGLFDCPGTDPVAQRVGAMLTAARMQVADLASLSALVDPFEVGTAEEADDPTAHGALAIDTSPARDLGAPANHLTRMPPDPSRGIQTLSRQTWLGRRAGVHISGPPRVS